MLDKLPAWVRHIAIMFAATFTAFFGQAIIAADGVSRLDFMSTFIDALDSSIVATVVVGLALYVTPLTRQYGIGEKEHSSSDDKFDIF
jgi:hypothetical protein